MNTGNNMPQFSISIVDEQTRLTLADLCRACTAEKAQIIALVDDGVLEPHGREPAHWVFSGTSLHRTRVALRLQRDLEMDLAGTALVLELLDEIASLKARLRVLGDE